MNAKAADREGFAAFILRARARGISSDALFKALETVPRQMFVSDDYADLTWSGQSLPIACGEDIEGVDFQAKILSSLDIVAGHRVLEIGTGSGFTAAVMARLGAKVKSVDRYKSLTEAAQERFVSLGLGNAVAVQMDGSRNMAGEGPFDRIVAWAAFENLPRKFVDLLATGGIMIAPIGPGDGKQKLAKLTKIGSRFERENIGETRAQPLIKGVAEAL